MAVSYSRCGLCSARGCSMENACYGRRIWVEMRGVYYIEA